MDFKLKLEMLKFQMLVRIGEQNNTNTKLGISSC